MSNPPERHCSCGCGCTVPIYVLQGEPSKPLCFCCRNEILLRGSKCFDGKVLDQYVRLVAT